MKLLVKTLQGLEEVLADELAGIGAKGIQILRRAVQFEGNLRMVYRANLELRTAIRILMPIAEFKAQNEEELYRQIRKINWSKYMRVDQTLAVNAVASSTVFNHSQYVALKTKDAIVDQFRDNTGTRPNVNLVNPDLRIHVFTNQTDISVSLDSSGDSLHKRGYRHETLEAPISEVLAAGIIMLSGWHGECTFIDPMCGSGTFLSEAALIACNLPPQLHRKEYGFQKWGNYDPKLWEEVYKKAVAKRSAPEHPILGFDKDFQAVKVAIRNLESAGLEPYVTVTRRQFERLVPPPGGGILIVNPPYDERLEQKNVEAFYKMIGDRLKQEFAGFEAWMITSNFDGLKSLGLRHSRKIILFNGKLECRLVKYELYKGSKKEKEPENL